MTIGIINYVLLGFQLPVDDFYMHSFEIWLATTVVFFGSGNVGYTILEYRLGQKALVSDRLHVRSSMTHSSFPPSCGASLRTSCGYLSCKFERDSSLPSFLIPSRPF